jgi:inward rectifier potassium channel
MPIAQCAYLGEAMSTRKHRRQPKPIVVGKGEYRLRRIGQPRVDVRDPYYFVLSLSWPAFVLVMIACWLTINLVFAALYVLRPGDVANAAPGSFSDAFFFSVETLATVGYGVMAPTTLYSHIVSSAEIVTGTAFTAIVTGLLFVRFARPKAKIVYANEAVITTRNGMPALMVRIANPRRSLMTGTTARLSALLEERTAAGGFLRRIHDLRLEQSYLPVFVMPWTLLHVIDADSPLFGHTSETLTASWARVFVTIEGRDHALAAMVQDMKAYPAACIRFGMHYADSVSLDEAGSVTADLTRISVLEQD